MRKKYGDWLAELERGFRAEGDDRFADAVHNLTRSGRDCKLRLVSRSPAQQAFYVAFRLDGMRETLAEMLALQRPPAALTDREFLEGHCNGNQFEGMEWTGDRYKALAEAAGVDISGKVYVSGLAAFPGDPRAWVSGRGDVQRVCEERGYTAEGAVSVRSGQRDPAPDVDVADDIVAGRMLDRLEADPGLALRPTEEVFHETRQQMKPHWAA